MTAREFSDSPAMLVLVAVAIVGALPLVGLLLSLVMPWSDRRSALLLLGALIGFVAMRRSAHD